MYLNTVKKHLEDKGKKDRIADFQKGAVELVKLILAKFDEFQL